MDVEVGKEIRGRIWKTGKCFNPGAIPLGTDGAIRLFPRYIHNAAKDGLPDAGKIKVLDYDANGSLRREHTIWKPGDQEIDSLEDFRCSVINSEGLVVIGLTAVINGIAHPGVVTLTNWGDGVNHLPKVRVLRESGKNTMVLNPKYPDIVAYRADGSDHQMQMVDISDPCEVRPVGKIAISGGDAWAPYRAGFAAPLQSAWDGQPVAIDMHGMTCENGFYKYSLGQGVLSGSIESGGLGIHLDDRAVCDSSILEGCRQLHPELRDAIYCVAAVGDLRAVSFGDVLTRWVRWSNN